MGVLFSVPWKKKTPGRPAERRVGERIRCPKLEPCFRLAFANGSPFGEKWQLYEQQLQKLVKMGFAEADVRDALERVFCNEILAIKMLRFAECAWVGNDTNTKLWQPDEQQVQKLVEMGFIEAAVGSALEAVNGDEILAIKMLCFAECGPAGIDTYRKLWQPDEQRVQKLVEMGFAEVAVRRALEAVNGDEILAIKMLLSARAGNYTNTKLDEQLVQKLVEMGFAEAAVRSALEAVNGVEILAIKMLRFAECARVGNYTNTKLWQPNEQQVQKLVETGCKDAAGRSALEAPVRIALEAVNGVEFLAIDMLCFAEHLQARNDANRKLRKKVMQKLVAEVAVEVLLMLFIICLFFVFLLNSEAVNGDEILAFKLMK